MNQKKFVSFIRFSNVNFLKTAQKISGVTIAKAVQNGFKAFGNSISTGAKNVATGTKNATTKLNEKMKNSNIKESTKIFGNKVAVGVKGAAGKVAVVSKEFMVIII